MSIGILHPTLGDKVALLICREIVRGDIKPGEHLSSESELAASLGVSKPVIRESLRELGSLGLIRIQHGKRTVVQDSSEWNVLDPTVQEAFRTEHRGAELALQLYELRQILEVGSAALAASRATPAQMTELNELAAQLRHIATVTADPHEFLRVDRQFHEAIGRASGNEALRQVIRNVHAFLTVAWIPSSVNGEELEELAALHEEIAQAIAAREADRASTAMERHLERAAGKVMSQFTDVETLDA